MVDSMADELASLVRHDYTPLVRFAYQLTHERTSAEDLLQESIVRLLKRSPALPTVSNLRGYLITTMVRHFLSTSNADHHHELFEQAVDVDFADSVVDRDLVWRMIGFLPARHRTVLVLTFYWGADDEQIAFELQCAAGTVRSLRSRAISSLRREFELERGTK